MLDRARQLRRDMTLPERLLWREIRSRRLGPRFRRQVPVGPHVVDFYCPAARLVIEVDGEFHGERQAEDDRRTEWLEGRGLRVVRFPAMQVLTDLDSVLERLLVEISPPARLGHVTREGPPSGPAGHLPREGGGSDGGSGPDGCLPRGAPLRP